MCILLFLHTYLQFCYISAAVTWYRVHGSRSTQFLRCSCRPATYGDAICSCQGRQRTDLAVSPSPDLVSGISYLRLCVYHRHLDSFKASWRQYFFARPTRHDSWLLRLLEFRLTNFPTYLLTYQPAPTEFGTKAVIVTYCTKFHKPKLCTKFEVATFNAEISKGSQISWDAIATLAPTLCQFWS